MTTRHVIFTGGGTAGHLFPGLAVAGELAHLAPGVRTTFVGSGAAFERPLVEAAGFHYLPISCRPLPRTPWQALRFVGGNARGCWQAGRLLHHLRPLAVVGLGGFASVPLARAAIAADVPLVLLEQNAVPGRATRWLAPGAALICTSFDLPANSLRAGGPVRLTGNPIRAGFSEVRSRHTPCAVTGCGTRSVPATLKAKADRYTSRLVVLGGSQGASALNRFVPRALRKVGLLLDGWEIVHQSGQRDLQATQASYARLGMNVTVLPFSNDMPELLYGADVAISRAGGTTLAELSAAGVPALLVPYPHAADDHQRHNAQVYVDCGGCVAVDQGPAEQCFDDRLAAVLAPMLTDRQLRDHMSAAMKLQARPDAAWRVAKLIAEIAQPLQRASAV